jgi:hypothetical protein
VLAGTISLAATVVVIWAALIARWPVSPLLAICVGSGLIAGSIWHLGRAADAAAPPRVVGWMKAVLAHLAAVAVAPIALLVWLSGGNNTQSRNAAVEESSDATLILMFVFLLCLAGYWALWRAFDPAAKTDRMRKPKRRPRR